MTKRGTKRKSVSMRCVVHERIGLYFKTSGEPENYSKFLESLLVEKHPDIFGPNAPLPPTPSTDELLFTKHRQDESRSRYDGKEFHKSVDQSVPKPSSAPVPVLTTVQPSAVKLLNSKEVLEEDDQTDKVRPKHMQPSVLVPVVVDKEDDEDGSYSGLMMF